jgi:hypothetical protein
MAARLTHYAYVQVEVLADSLNVSLKQAVVTIA